MLSESGGVVALKLDSCQGHLTAELRNGVMFTRELIERFPIGDLDSLAALCDASN